MTDFMVLDAEWFHREMLPALCASWDRRSFEPCRPLCAALVPRAAALAREFHLSPEEPLLSRVAGGLSFDRHFWRLLVGEVLFYGAEELPEIETCPESLCLLLAPDSCREGPAPRERFAPIQQAHFGTRDLRFGAAFYRPEHAGYNNTEDVIRLADYLAAVDPDRWSADALAGLPGVTSEEERADELDFAREWFPALRQLYGRLRGQGRVIVCEVL